VKISLSIEGGPKLLAGLSLLPSTAAVLYIVLGQQVALAEAVQIALISGYGQVTAFIAGSHA
jgi:hypothetical protein